MENLFSYGTLQDQKIQLEIFGRYIHGVPVMDRDGRTYPCAIPSAHKRLEGERFVVPEADLQKADEYEGTHYTRVKDTLQSGVEAWIYVRSK